MYVIVNSHAALTLKQTIIHKHVFGYFGCKVSASVIFFHCYLCFIRIWTRGAYESLHLVQVLFLVSHFIIMLETVLVCLLILLFIKLMVLKSERLVLFSGVYRSMALNHFLCG